MKVEIEVVTGFLGAGKSAFINSILELTAIKHEKIVVVQFEDGITKINTEICKKYGVLSVEHSSNTSEEYEDIILDIINRLKPHRIIIESNGTITIDILLSKLYSKEIKRRAKITSIYFIADCKTFDFYIKNMGEILIPSIEISNLIIINNCEQASNEMINNTKTIFEEVNSIAHILTVENNREVLTVLRNSGLFSKRTLKKIILRALEKKVNR